MAKKPSKPERAPRPPREPRVTLTATGLHALLHFTDRLGHPDQLSPAGPVFAWPAAGAILVLTPGRERCALRDDRDEAFFELLGWCVYHRIELDLLAPEEFDEGFGADEDAEDRAHAVTFRDLSPEDIKRHPELDSSDTQNWTPDQAVPTSGPASVFRFSSPDRLFSRRR